MATKGQRSIYAPGTKHMVSWAAVDWEHRWVMRKCVESMALFYVGDVLAQAYVLRRFKHALDAKASTPTGPSRLKSNFWRDIIEDWSALRSLRAGLFGLLLYGPLRLRWGKSLDRVLPFAAKTSNAGSGRFVVAREDYPVLAKRLALEYAVWLPSSTAVCLLFLCICDGNVSDFLGRVGLQYPQMLRDSALIWAPTQALCFAIVPPWSWNVVTGVATVLWGAMLAYRNFIASHTARYGKILPPNRYRV
jgi:hypothetical protein